MKRLRIYRHLVVGIGCFLFHFATLNLCYATQDENTAKVSDPVAQTPPKGLLPAPLLSMNTNSGAFSQYAFLADKKDRTLTVWKASGDSLELMGAWPTDIGRRDGDKAVQGDHRTPEGVYFFQEAYESSQLDFNLYGVRAFTMDYPNYFDRLEKKTGSGIWLHAIPDTVSLFRGSRGCVVVRNKVIEELAKYIDLKRTPIVVVNKVDYLEPKKWQETREALKAWLESWRKSWGNKDLEAYMAQYSDRFSGNGMTKSQWRAYKKSLNEKYQFIDVKVEDVQIFNQGHKIVFRFLQTYKSDQKEDFGRKTLYAQKVDDHYEIVGETWEPDTSLTAASRN